MPKKVSNPPLKPTIAEVGRRSSPVAPLTRRGYKRLPEIETQIAEAGMLDATALLARARHREAESGYLAPESLVHFIRRADRDGNQKLRDELFRELFGRCKPFFRGQFRAFDRAMREDLQQEVSKKVVEAILARDDRADFLEARFWKYLKARSIDACRPVFVHKDRVESLDTGYSGDGESEGRTKLESQADPMLSPEELAMVSKGLATLPPKLRLVFVLRHAVGMAIGADNPADDPPGKLTLAQHFDCSGRTIRSWLEKADDLLAGWGRKEKEDDSG
jgi:DNA-directed RNA polymerase specialized sigma24 family protein